MKQLLVCALVLLAGCAHKKTTTTAAAPRTAATPPPPAAEAAAAPEEPPPPPPENTLGLGKDQILEVVKSHAHTVRQCRDAHAPSAVGKVVLTWQIETNGQVSSVQVDDSTLRRPAAERCIVREVRTWLFPKAKLESRVTFPFFFQGQ